VKNKFIIPITNSRKLSYCDNQSMVSPATVFILHTWGSNILEVVSALTGHLNDAGKSDAVV